MKEQQWQYGSSIDEHTHTLFFFIKNDFIPKITSCENEKKEWSESAKVVESSVVLLYKTTRRLDLIIAGRFKIRSWRIVCVNSLEFDDGTMSAVAKRNEKKKTRANMQFLLL